MKPLLLILTFSTVVAAQTSQPIIVTDGQNRFRPLVMNAVTHQAEPFEPTSLHNLSDDKRTRLILFARGVTNAASVVMRDMSGTEQYAIVEGRDPLSDTGITQLTVLVPQALDGPITVWLVDNNTKGNETVISFRSSKGLLPSNPVTLIFAGNSLTAGYDMTAPLPIDQQYPQQVCNELKRQGYNVQCFNGGIGGQTTTEMLQRASVDVDPLITSSSIVVVWEIGNDLMFTSSTEAQLFEHVASYCVGRKKLGAKVVVLTVPWRRDIAADPTKEAIRQRINARLRQEYKDFADVLVDLDVDARLPTLMQLDQVHYLPFGYSAIAEDVVPSAVGLIKGYLP